jgi:hypothetical protein
MGDISHITTTGVNILGGGAVTRHTIQDTSAGILEQSMEARNLVGIGLSDRPAVLRRLAESIPWNRFLGSFNVYKYGLWASRANYSILSFSSHIPPIGDSR